MNFNKPLKLICPVKNYLWGKKAKDSLVFKIAQKNSQINLDPALAYAELWLGAHPSSSAEVELDGHKILLSELIKSNAKELLGEKVFSKFGSNFPFLMKILSIGTALSIQAHPDKQRAKVLHAKDPKNYPDDNHKPEMGYALSEVEILFGFRKVEEILKFLEQVEELKILLPDDLRKKLFGNNLQEAEILKEIYAAIFNAPQELIKKAQDSLIRKIKSRAQLTPEESWILKLAEEYPQGDVGIFSFYILRYLVLHPGEAIFIGPNIVHAYLSGELVECMATSDNVVRAGLTPKYKDVNTLLEMLDYQSNELNLLKPEIIGERKIFRLPADEFSLEVLETKKQNKFLISKDSPAIVFCEQGSAMIDALGVRQQMLAGEVFFLPVAVAKNCNLEVEKGRVFLAACRGGF